MSLPSIGFKIEVKQRNRSFCNSQQRENYAIPPTIVTIIAALAYADPMIGALGIEGGESAVHQSLNKTNPRCEDSTYISKHYVQKTDHVECY